MILVASASATYYSGFKLDFSALTKMVGSLQNVTAAIFALTGIWLAISYPEAIKSYINPHKVSLLKGSVRTKRIERIVLTIFAAAYALTLTVLLQWSVVFKTAFELDDGLKHILTSIYCGLLLYITFVVIRGLWSILYINFQITNELHDKKDEAEADDDLSS